MPPFPSDFQINPGQIRNKLILFKGTSKDFLTPFSRTITGTPRIFDLNFSSNVRLEDPPPVYFGRRQKQRQGKKEVNIRLDSVALAHLKCAYAN